MNSTISRVPPSRLRRVRWQPTRAYRAMDYYFLLRFNKWPCGSIGDYLDHVLGGFEVPLDDGEVRNPPTPGLPTMYSLLALRSDPRPYRLYHGETSMYSAEDPSYLMVHLFWHINAEAIRQTGSYLLIHAGAVVSGSGEAILLPATSGSGKTTLTAALVKAGYGYLSDEAAAIDPVSGEVYGYPKALTMKNRAMLEVLGCAEEPAGWENFMSEGRHVHPHELRPNSVTKSAPVSYVIAPRYEAGAATTIEPLTAAETAAELLSQTMNSPRYRRRALPIVASVARKARGYRLVSGNLDEAVAAVQELTGGVTSATSA